MCFGELPVAVLARGLVVLAQRVGLRERVGVERIGGVAGAFATRDEGQQDGQAQRIVLGDWYEQGSVLRMDADGAVLSRLPAQGFA